MEQSFIAFLEDSIKKNWDLDALTDYKGATLQYKDVARKIEKLHIIFELSGIKQGDKIAVCVIGGAGSIGSSFIKAVLPFKPSKLIVIDLNENGLAELARDLRSMLSFFYRFG